METVYLCTVGYYLPSFLLKFGCPPFSVIGTARIGQQGVAGMRADCSWCRVLLRRGRATSLCQLRSFARTAAQRSQFDTKTLRFDVGACVCRGAEEAGGLGPKGEEREREREREGDRQADRQTDRQRGRKRERERERESERARTRARARERPTGREIWSFLGG